MTNHLTLIVDADGIALVTWDSPGRSVNVVSHDVEVELAEIVERVASDPSVVGAVIASAKPGFIAGYDLLEILRTFGPGLDVKEAYRKVSGGLQRVLRRIETSGKPWAAAINGAALGGGLEVCLACHHRVIADDPAAVIGLPEVKVGLLPGAGGTQRLPRLVGIAKALPLLLEGVSIGAQRAQELGIVHEVVAPSEVVSTARRWILSRPVATQPWDEKAFRIPGGAPFDSSEIAQTFVMQSSLVASRTMHNYPAPAEILSTVFEGSVLPIDRGLEVESQCFARLATDPVSRNLIRTMFVNKGRADKLSVRPPGIPRTSARKLGVLGAGMMGAGVALASAAAGIEVVLIDTTGSLAEKGKEYAAKRLSQQVEKGLVTGEQRQKILDRIMPTTDYTRLSEVDLVIEAVFEDRKVKAEVTRRAEAAIPDSAVFASNTSTLPISGLAESSTRPENFIGIHFFSPVDRMSLVEVIVGARTSEETVARALDYIAQLKKTPIVVNDSRGFYTSRCFSTYTSEGCAMLAEGVDPVLIENAGRLAGMPVGPLAVLDEISIELGYQIMRQSRSDLGPDYREPISWPVIRHFVEDLKRLGRKHGAGFYEYPQGQPKRLWLGLKQEFKQLEAQPGIAELRKRLLFVQALEAARCYEEGVLRSVHEADLGSILGWGFPAYTGGVLSMIDTVGVREFVEDCRQMAQRHGERFAPPDGLVQRAMRGEPFHSIN